MQILDLTHSIRNGMMIYPGDPEIFVAKGLEHETDYCHVDRIHLNTHTGTHIDAPFHFLPDGRRITDYEVSKFCPSGLAVNLTYKLDGEPITVSDLQYSPIIGGSAVVLVTGWYRYFGTERYLNHPYITAEAAQYLVDQGVSIVGVDFLNVDRTLTEAWDAHPILLGNDTLIVENLNNTLELSYDRTYRFSFLPLKVEGSDGSPIRAIAF